LSPPVRRRGLKLELAGKTTQAPKVASRAEAWIETVSVLNGSMLKASRLPCGGVD
jgi:hypothetical protein